MSSREERTIAMLLSSPGEGSRGSRHPRRGGPAREDEKSLLLSVVTTHKGRLMRQRPGCWGDAGRRSPGRSELYGLAELGGRRTPRVRGEEALSSNSLPSFQEQKQQQKKVFPTILCSCLF